MGLYENKNNSLSLLAGGTCYADSPVGAILPFGGSNPPSGYLLCDGQAVSRSYYAELFTVIGTSFGAGDGSTTFNVPNLKGKTTVGFDSSDTAFNAIGKSGGEKTHKLTVTELPSHAHKTGISSTNAYGAGPAGSATAQVLFSQTVTDTSYIGGNGAHNNLQPYVTTNYIIKAKQSALPLPFEDAIDDKIATLDVASVGGSGKYISAISETDGIISATATNLSTAPTSGSTVPITSGGVYSKFESFHTWTDVTSQAVTFKNTSDMSSNFIHVYTNGYECSIEGEYQLASNYETITGGWISNLSHIAIKAPYLPKRQAMLGGFIVNDNHGPIIWYLSVGGGFQGYTGSTATTLQRVPITGRWCI